MDIYGKWWSNWSTTMEIHILRQMDCFAAGIWSRPAGNTWTNRTASEPTCYSKPTRQRKNARNTQLQHETSCIGLLEHMICSYLFFFMHFKMDVERSISLLSWTWWTGRISQRVQGALRAHAALHSEGGVLSFPYSATNSGVIKAISHHCSDLGMGQSDQALSSSKKWMVG